jgi:hypothetical protein
MADSTDFKQIWIKPNKIQKNQKLAHGVIVCDVFGIENTKLVIW